MKKLLVFLLILLVYLAHQDIWNWKSAGPLFLGFLPVGLAYHAGYSVLCAMLMAVLVKIAWPKHLEAQENTGEDSGGVRQRSSKVGASRSDARTAQRAVPTKEIKSFVSHPDGEEKAGLTGS